MKTIPARTLARAAAAAAGLVLALGCAASPRNADPPAGAAASADPGEVVAEVDGERVTLAEVDRHALERAAPGRVYELRREALDELVARRLVDKAAAARGVSAEQLLRMEVDGRVSRPSAAEVQALFDQSGLAARGATLAQLRPRIEESLLEQRRAERRAAYVEELRQRASVRITMVEPRAAVAVPPEAPTLGPADAKVTVVEFLDYQCPYCHKVQGVVDQVLARYPGQVRFVHREFLLGNPRSLPAARAARCAGEQGRFWEYHRRLLTEPGDNGDADLARKASAVGLDGARFSACLASDRHDASIQQAVEQGQAAGVSGTPTFFINGRRLVGVRPFETFQQMIEEELKRAS